MNAPLAPSKKSHFFLKKIKPWHVLISTLTLGALVVLFFLILIRGHRTSAVLSDNQHAEGSLVDSGGGSSASRPPNDKTNPLSGNVKLSPQSPDTSTEEEEGENLTKIVQKEIPKATVEAVNRIIDVAASKDEVQARSEIDGFRENWKKAAKGDISNVDPEVRVLVEIGEKSADMILEEQVKNELKQALSTSTSSMAQVQKALDKYHAVVKHLNVKKTKIAAIGDSNSAENLCEVRLRELSRKVKSGTRATKDISDEAISLLRAPGEFMSLGLAGRLNLVDNIKKTPYETLKRFFDADLALYNDYYEAKNTSDMYGNLKLSMSRTQFSFSDLRCLDSVFNKDSRIEDIQEILNSSKAADPKVVQKFIQACSKLEHLVPPHFILEEVCQQLDSEPELLSRFIERYIIYGVNLKEKTFQSYASAIKSDDTNILLKAGKKNKKRMGLALKLRDAFHLKINPSITDKGITESSEWKKFADNPKERSVFKNLIKKLESLGLKAAAMKNIAKKMKLRTQVTELLKTTPEYKNVCAIDALCDLFSMDVPTEERKYFDIMKKHFFDMKKSEALDAFYQILRLNKALFFKMWKRMGIPFVAFGLKEHVRSHDVFKLIVLIINASFEQEGALSALFFVATLEEIITQSPKLSVSFRDLPDKLLEAIKETNVPLPFLRDFHANISDDSKADDTFELSALYSKIIEYVSPNSFLALDYNLHKKK